MWFLLRASNDHRFIEGFREHRNHASCLAISFSNLTFSWDHCC